MFFRYILFATVIFISSNLLAQEQCSDFFNGVETSSLEPGWILKDDLDDALQPNEIALLERESSEAQDLAFRRLNEYKRRLDLLDKYRDVNDTYERKSILEARQNILKFELYIKFGDNRKAHEIYEQLFYDVEYNYWKIKIRTQQLNELLVKEKQNGSLSLSEQEKKKLYLQERSEAAKAFGENYVEYKIVRSYMENIIKYAKAYDAGKYFENDSDSTKSAEPIIPPPEGLDDSSQSNFVNSVKWVFGQLGVSSFSRIQPQAGIPTSRVSLEDVKSLYRSDIEARLAKINREIREEKKVRHFKVSYLLLKGIRNVLYKIPPRVGPIQARKIVSEFFSLSYDVYVRDLYVPKLMMLSRIHGSTEEKLKLLMDLNASTNDELLLTFGRIASDTDVWLQIKNLASKKGENSVLIKDFHDRMMKVEEKIPQFGVIPMFFEESASDRFNKIILTSVVPGLGTAAYMYWDQIQAWMLAALTTFQ